MRDYFQKLENCHHRPVWRFLKKLLGVNPTRHGFDGWLSTSQFIALVLMAIVVVIWAFRPSLRRASN